MSTTKSRKITKVVYCDCCESRRAKPGLYLCQECFDSLMRHFKEQGSPDPEADAIAFSSTASTTSPSASSASPTYSYSVEATDSDSERLVDY